MEPFVRAVRTLIAAALFVLVGALVVSPMAAVGAAEGTPVYKKSDPKRVNLRVVTFNTAVDQPFSSAMTDLEAVFARRPDIVALQEFWSPKRQQAVRDLYTDCEDCAYDMFLPIGDGRGSVPIIFRSDRFTLAGARSVRVTEDTYVGPRGAGPSTIAGKYVNHVVLRDLATNRTINVLNNHFVPSVQGANGGANRTMKARLALYRTHMNNLLAMIDEISLGVVVVTGDFNVNYRRDRIQQARMFPYRNFSSIGLRANFGQLREPRTGTHRLPDGNDTRLIDQIWNSGGASVILPKWQRIMLGLSSDHRPLLVSYAVSKRDVAAPPTPEDPPEDPPNP